MSDKDIIVDMKIAKNKEYELFNETSEHSKNTDNFMNKLGNLTYKYMAKKDEKVINNENIVESSHMSETEVKQLLNNYNKFILESSNKNAYFEKRSIEWEKKFKNLVDKWVDVNTDANKLTEENQYLKIKLEQTNNRLINKSCEDNTINININDKLSSLSVIDTDNDEELKKRIDEYKDITSKLQKQLSDLTTERDWMSVKLSQYEEKDNAPRKCRNCFNLFFEKENIEDACI